MFSTFKIGQLEIKNRFVMSAAADNLNEDLDARIKRFSELATGQVGLIISGAVRLSELQNWKKVIEAVHSHGGKIVLQLITETGPGVFPWTSSDTDKIAVSKLEKNSPYFHAFVGYGKHHEATENEIKELITTYAQLAAGAKKVGADGVQIHAAHQSFPSQFLSPLTNKRTDRWGGSLENRVRIHGEMIKSIREKVGDQFPVLIKLGVEDAFAEGLKFCEGKQAAKLIAKMGYDAIEISQGLMKFDEEDFMGTPMRSRVRRIEDEAYFLNWCREIKSMINKPTILTGGIRSYELADQLIKNSDTDLIGMCRPFIREPGLISRWQKGDMKKSTCTSCNLCTTELLLNGLPLECFLDRT